MRRTVAAAIALIALVAGCGQTVRDEHGDIHDTRYVADQAQAMVTNAPLLVPFAPVGMIGNVLKALPENGEIDIAGTVLDEGGTPINGVELRATCARLVTFDLNNDGAVFREKAHRPRRLADGSFRLRVTGEHTMRLVFAKPGFEDRVLHVELAREEGWSHDAVGAASASQEIYGRSPVVRRSLHVVMRRAGQPTTATAAGSSTAG